MQDVRIRSSNRPTKVPSSYRAYIYCWYGVDSADYKVIIASDKPHADQLLRDFCYQQGLDNTFWRFVSDDDFMICGNDTDMCDILF